MTHLLNTQFFLLTLFCSFFRYGDYKKTVTICNTFSFIKFFFGGKNKEKMLHFFIKSMNNRNYFEKSKQKRGKHLNCVKLKSRDGKSMTL